MFLIILHSYSHASLKFRKAQLVKDILSKTDMKILGKKVYAIPAHSSHFQDFPKLGRDSSDDEVFIFNLSLFLDYNCFHIFFSHVNRRVMPVHQARNLNTMRRITTVRKRRKLKLTNMMTTMSHKVMRKRVMTESHKVKKEGVMTERAEKVILLISLHCTLNNNLFYFL